MSTNDELTLHHEQASTYDEAASTHSSELPNAAQNTPVTLHVGERRFTTTRETLTERSHFFAILLSGRWDNRQTDGSYFIDADPRLFDHILTYLRRGVFPVFFDAVKGHDLPLYTSLLQEARYFQIPKLIKWLEDKTYLKAVKVTYLSYVVRDEAALATNSHADDRVLHFPTWTTKKVYICPRGIFVHRGNRDQCGRQCQNAQRGQIMEYEDEPVLTTLVIRKVIAWDESLVCGEIEERID